MKKVTKILKKNKKPIFAGLLLVALIIAYFFRSKWLPLFKGGPEADLNSTQSSTVSSQQNATNETVLKLGSKGEKVKILQRLLNEDIYNHVSAPLFIPELVVDGDFGSKTEAMLLRLHGQKTVSIKKYEAAHQHSIT